MGVDAARFSYDMEKGLYNNTRFRARQFEFLYDFSLTSFNTALRAVIGTTFPVLSMARVHALRSYRERLLTGVFKSVGIRDSSNIFDDYGLMI